jgi:putative ABC transport system substrate-binding protein
VGGGFVDSLARRPGGNATGFLLFEYGLSGKMAGAAQAIAPGVTRAAIIEPQSISRAAEEIAAA